MKMEAACSSTASVSVDKYKMSHNPELHILNHNKIIISFLSKLCDAEGQRLTTTRSSLATHCLSASLGGRVLTYGSVFHDGLHHVNPSIPKFQRFGDITLCRWVGSYRCFDESTCLHLQGKAVQKVLNCLTF